MIVKGLLVKYLGPYQRTGQSPRSQTKGVPVEQSIERGRGERGERGRARKGDCLPPLVTGVRVFF